MRRYTHFISISLLLHATLLIAFFVWPSLVLRQNANKPEKFEVILENNYRDINQLKENKSRKPKSLRSGQSNASGQNEKILPQRELGYLTPNYLRDPKAVNEIALAEDIIGGHGEAPTSGESLEINRFLDEIGRRVDGALKYPEEFVAHGLGGGVQIRVRISETGEMQGPIRQLDSGNHLLAIYAAAAVTAALRKPLPPTLWSKKPIEVSFRVRFQLQSLNQDSTDQLWIVSNQIHINRIRYKEDPLFIALDKVRKYLVVIPLPGGFYIDFMALLKLVEEWDEPSREWTQARRLEILSESLDRMYQKQQPTRTQVGEPTATPKSR